MATAYLENTIPYQANLVHMEFPPFCGYGDRTPVVTIYHNSVWTKDRVTVVCTKLALSLGKQNCLHYSDTTSIGVSTFWSTTATHKNNLLSASEAAAVCCNILQSR